MRTVESRLDRFLTGEKPSALYRLSSRAKAGTILDHLAEKGWQGFHIDGNQVKDKASFLKTGAEAMQFPGYFGQNWDAFEDCLNDLEWVPAKGYVVLYDRVRRFAQSQPEEWKMARHILTDAVAQWQKTDTPMVVLLRNTWWYARDVEKI